MEEKQEQRIPTKRWHSSPTYGLEVGVSCLDFDETGDRHLAKMFALLRTHSSQPIEDQLKLWDRIVFNYLIGNTDRMAAKEAGLGERMALNRLDEMIKRFRPALESAAETLIHQGVKGIEALKAAILGAGSERYLSTAPTHHKELEEK